MHTQCPNCSTIYEVGARELAVARGQVRCGFCDTTFDALTYLTEDVPAPPPAPPAGGAGPRTDPVDLRLEGLPEGAADSSAADAEVVAAVAMAEPPAAGARATDAIAEQAAVAEAIPPPAPRTGAPPSPAPRRYTGRVPTPEDERADAEDLRAYLTSRGNPWARAAWGMVAGLLVLLLIAQAAHHWRSVLIRQPVAAQVLQPAYDALGLQLDASWDVTLYELLRHAAISAQAGQTPTLRLAAAVANRAARAQPAPFVRLTLEDRWGTPVAARDFGPDEYSPGRRCGRLLAPGEQLDVELTVVYPAGESVGYNLDLCLPARSGQLRCKSDAS